MKMGEFGFPVSKADFRSIVSNYLDRRGVKIRQFADNKPGKDFIAAFLDRNKELSFRTSANVSLKLPPDCEQ